MTESRDGDEILRRMEEEWERFPGETLEGARESVGPGWGPLAEEAWRLVTGVGGRVKQVKEKFGRLRIYADRFPEDRADDVRRQLAVLEKRSATLCEWCGAPGEIRDDEYQAALPPGLRYRRPWWIKTLCDHHAWLFYCDLERWW